MFQPMNGQPTTESHISVLVSSCTVQHKFGSTGFHRRGRIVRPLAEAEHHEARDFHLKHYTNGQTQTHNHTHTRNDFRNDQTLSEEGRTNASYNGNATADFGMRFLVEGSYRLARRIATKHYRTTDPLTAKWLRFCILSNPRPGTAEEDGAREGRKVVCASRGGVLFAGLCWLLYCSFSSLVD